MTSSGDGGFRFIQIESDEEELVVHAGSGRAATDEDGANAPEPRQSGDAASEQPSLAGDGVAQATAEADFPQAETASEGTETAAHARLRRRAEELEAAEAGLENPKVFPKMQVAVLAVLAIALVVFLAYFFGLRG